MRKLLTRLSGEPKPYWPHDRLSKCLAMPRPSSMQETVEGYYLLMCTCSSLSTKPAVTGKVASNASFLLSSRLYVPRATAWMFHRAPSCSLVRSEVGSSPRLTISGSLLILSWWGRQKFIHCLFEALWLQFS